MYPNVRAEIARKNLTLTVIAERMGIGVSTLSTKLKNGNFTVTEAKKLKEIVGTTLTLEELFETEGS